MFDAKLPAKTIFSNFNHDESSQPTGETVEDAHELYLPAVKELLLYER